MAGEPTKADYGLDAPGVVVGSAVAGAAALAGAGVGWAALRRRHPVPAAVLGGWLAAWARSPSPKPGSWSAAAGRASSRSATGCWTSCPGGGRVGPGRWLRPRAAAGRGAKRLPSGRAIGLDVWRTRDQAGNDPTATLANARRRGRRAGRAV